MQKHTDRKWMQQALELAKLGEGRVEPNPMVGCVIVDQVDADTQVVVGSGFHKKFGGAHAEVNAINDASDNGYSDFGNSTLYVNLEPCCHHGKTPPCTDSILRSGIRRVVVGMADPFPEVAGKGISLLKKHGVEVIERVLEQQSTNLNAPFLKLQSGRPWVIAKWAMTLDGKIATSNGSSQWISGERSRQIVHQLRARVDAVVVGIGTALADDPRLTVRLDDQQSGLRIATRIVVDSVGRLPLDSHLVKTSREIPTMVVTANGSNEGPIKRLRDAGCEILEMPKLPFQKEASVDICALLAELGRRKMTNILVEGGGALLGSMFDDQLIDEVHAFVAPTIAGGANAPSPIGGEGVEQMEFAKRLTDLRIQQVESDIYFQGRI